MRLAMCLVAVAMAEEAADAAAADADAPADATPEAGEAESGEDAEDDFASDADIVAGQQIAAQTSVYAYSWNPFRYTGDFLHLAGIIVLLWTIVKRQSVAGLSQKTQILYTLIYCTRYLDLLDHSQALYLVAFKITFIFTSLLSLSAFQRFNDTWERAKDTCSISIFIGGSFFLALFLTAEYTLLELLWTFSEFLEAVAMVPQYVFSYRDQNNREVGVTAFVMLIGSYRIMYCFNWMYKKYQVPAYSDLDSWLAGLIEILLYADFVTFKFRGKSFLRHAVLAIDLKVHEVRDTLGRGVLGGESVTFENHESGELRRRKRVVDDEPLPDA